MRAIIDYIISADALSAPARDDWAERALGQLGWTMPRLAVERDDLVRIASDLIATAGDVDNLPLSPESQHIQDAIDAFDTKGEFKRFSFERGCLAQAILILTQIPAAERARAYPRKMSIVVSPDYDVCGVIFGDITGSGSYQVRLRCNDVDKLQAASSEYASALSGGRVPGAFVRFTSRSASVVGQQPNAERFRTTFQGVRIRSIANEEILSGQVIPIRGYTSLLWRAFRKENGAGVLLLVLSVILIGLSALLYWQWPHSGWWDWTDQVLGRLATGAFGALLVESAVEYTALRRSLLSLAGRFRSGAIIRWTKIGSH